MAKKMKALRYLGGLSGRGDMNPAPAGGRTHERPECLAQVHGKLPFADENWLLDKGTLI